MRLPPRPPARIEIRREGIAEIARQIGRDAAAQQVVVDGEARAADRLQHRIAQFLAKFQLGAVRRLEQQAVEADHLHQRSVAQQYGMIVQQRAIGQHAAGGARGYGR